MAALQRVQLFFDGGNFFHLVLKKLGLAERDFRYEEFSQYLAGERQITQQGKRYYVGTVREREGDAKSKLSMSHQTRHLTLLKSHEWEIKTSKLRFRRERIIIDQRVEGYKNLLKKGIKEIVYERMREKGIDVKLATDLIVGAIDDRYDTAIIISSDTDLFPAMDWVRKRKHKKIEYIGFSILDKRKIDRPENTAPLPTMIAHSDIQRTLAEADLKRFVIATPDTLL